MIFNLSSTSIKNNRFMVGFYNYFIAFIFGLLPFTSPAQGWQTEVSDPAYDLYGVYFLNSTTGWACGTEGKILKTATPGVWVSQPSSASKTLVSISFPNANDGCVVGTKSNNKLRTTSNGGTSWNSISDPTAATGALHDVQFFTISDGWACGANGDILKSDDGGDSWDTQLTATILTIQRLRSIFFLDTQTGWAVGEQGHILKTTVGGEDIGGVGDSGDDDAWDLAADLSMTTLYAITFIDANTGWVVGTDGAIRKSADGGATWTVQTSGTTETLRAVSFANASTGWIVGTGGVTLKTTDGGATWGMQVSGTAQDLHDLWVLDANTALAVGANGTIIKTSDGGGTVTFPVELMSFTAKELNKNTIKLNWETASENNNKGFSVEWSKDASIWQELTFVTGNGTVTETQQYQFSHRSPILGVNYYRLKQLDFDGTFEYSPIRSIERDAEGAKLTVYPNPVRNGQLMISVEETVEHNYRYIIYNSLGMFILKGQSIGLGKGQIEIDVQSLTHGMYHLELFKDDELIGGRSFLR